MFLTMIGSKLRAQDLWEKPTYLERCGEFWRSQQLQAASCPVPSSWSIRLSLWLSETAPQGYMDLIFWQLFRQRVANVIRHRLVCFCTWPQGHESTGKRNSSPVFSLVNSLTLTTACAGSFGLGNFSKESTSPWSINFPGQACDVFLFTEIKSTHGCSGWLTGTPPCLYCMSGNSPFASQGQWLPTKRWLLWTKPGMFRVARLNSWSGMTVPGSPLLSYPLDPDSSCPEHSASKTPDSTSALHPRGCERFCNSAVNCFWARTEP